MALRSVGKPAGDLRSGLSILAVHGDDLGGEGQIYRCLARTYIHIRIPVLPPQRLETYSISLKIKFSFIKMLCFSQGRKYKCF